jgi:hypothetical protein
VIGLLGLLATLAAACSAQNAPPLPPALSAPPSTSTAPVAAFGLAPLTNEPAASAQVAARNAIAVAITLRAGAPAPVGLDAADYVFEEVAGPGNHRLIAIFQSRDATRIGPVGSPRPMDLKLLPALRPISANDGQPSRFYNGLRSNPRIIDHSYPVDSGAYQHSGGWLYTSTAAQYAHASAQVAPPNLFPFVQPGLRMASVAAHATSAVTVALPGEPAQVWTFDTRRGVFNRAAPAVAVANIIVLLVPFRLVATSNKRTAAQVETADLVGSGSCLVASAGFSTPCTWSRNKNQSITNVLDSKGYPIRLAPGATWVVLAPTSTKISIR